MAADTNETYSAYRSPIMQTIYNLFLRFTQIIWQTIIQFRRKRVTDGMKPIQAYALPFSYNPRDTHNGSAVRDDPFSTPSEKQKHWSEVQESLQQAHPNKAPNISLNLHTRQRTGKLVFAAVAGVLLQTGVLVFAGFVAYNSRLRSVLGPADVRLKPFIYQIYI